MPELPEVETVKNLLIPIVKDRKILSIEVKRKSIIEGDENVFVSSLIGETFLDIKRIGKYLIFILTNDKVIISHLRMEGKFYSFSESEKDSKYARIVFHLNDDLKLCYDDSRSFGRMKLSDINSYQNEKEIAKLGPEPFFANSEKLYQNLTKIKGPIKNTLLDQTVMTGLGNIYVDETLYRTKLHPLTPTNSISKEKWEEIVLASRDILNDAIKMGGSTIKSYHPGKGIDGNFQVNLKVYGKRDERCPICDSHFKFMKVGGRGTTYCPFCQKPMQNPIKIGIFGKSGSGKSTVLETLNKLGYNTISADKIVHDLYQKESVKYKIITELNLDKNSDFVSSLREHLSSNEKDIKKVNKIVHPLVRSEINTFMEKDKGNMVFAEVPLLFEAGMAGDFDFLIAIDVNEKVQLERLLSRNKKTALDIKKINSYSKFDINKKKADFVINNNTSLIDLNNQIETIINKLKSLQD